MKRISAEPSRPLRTKSPLKTGVRWLRVVPLRLTRSLDLDAPLEAEKLADPGELVGARSGEGEKPQPGAVGLGLRLGPTLRQVVLSSGFELGRRLSQFAPEILRQDLVLGLGFGQLGGFDRLSSSTPRVGD